MGRRGRPPFPGVLTPREHEVVDLVARGLSNAEIAAGLGISDQTVKYHLNQVYSKLGLPSREELIAWRRSQRKWASWLTLRALPLPGALRLAGGAVAVGAVLVTVGLALMLVLSDDDNPPALSDPTASSDAAEIEATWTPAAATTPVRPTTPTAYEGGPRLIRLARGERLDASVGVLLLDPSTGGGDFWQLPDSGRPHRVSPSGRFISWYEQPPPASGLGPQGFHVLDTQTGIDRPVGAAPKLGIPVSFAPDDSRMVLVTPDDVVVAEPDTGRKLLTVTLPTSAQLEHLQAAKAEWSPDSRAVAVAVGSSAWLVVGDEPRPLPPEIVGMEWSYDGERVAVSSLTRSWIFTAEGTELVSLPAGAFNPRWSYDDRFLALNFPERSSSKMRIFELPAGDEVLRLSGVPACFDDYWLPRTHSIVLEVEPARALEVPSGVEVVPQGGAAHHIWARDDGALFRSDQSSVYIELTGTRLAEVAAPVGWSTPITWDQFDIFRSDGRAALLYGRDGRTLCQRPEEPLEVLFPPFN